MRDFKPKIPPVKPTQSAAPNVPSNTRHRVLLGLLLLFYFGLMLRATYLHSVDNDFLQQQGSVRLLKKIDVPAYRGSLFDRDGNVLAASSPVASVWVKARTFLAEQAAWQPVLSLLHLDETALYLRLKQRKNQSFTYLKRHISPTLAQQIKALNIAGLHIEQEYRRFYPAGQYTAHVLGFSNIDEVGQEGLELSLQQQLSATAGKQRGWRDPQGRWLAPSETLKQAKHGTDIQLSLDRRLSVVALQALSQAVERQQAQSGSVVILKATTGEILAMVNAPAYNPNDRNDRNSQHYRNRAITDVFEPGSTLKPFTLAAALDQGLYQVDSIIKTEAGLMKIGRFEINDSAAYGDIDFATVLRKSSNIGAAKIALSLSAEALWNVLFYAGFGVALDTQFPGERQGRLPYYEDWNSVTQASLGFGYGVNANLLQLARAYTAFANQGELLPVRFLLKPPKQGNDTQRRTRVFSAETAATMLDLMVAVVSPQGTGKRAQVAGYRLAGKTGTVRKNINGVYAKDRYVSLFVGLGPVPDPELIVAILIDEPSNGVYYGGQVAAPVFAEIMAKSLPLIGMQ